ncbi:hypothetical protein HX001_14395 [Empedobacter brevis]|uniref:Uncharacterized protein n=1 Tax=Empedobacter brevis TaxID=247 RepID=A0AAJ1QGT3_9FLAO|nr:terminase small subunit [Empedobacter brevis]MDM1073676.1 hypothetical protein [Empedobacter brevis]
MTKQSKSQIIKEWKSSDIKIKKDSKGLLWVVLGKEKVRLPKDLTNIKSITLSQAEGFLGLDKAINDLVDDVEKERKVKSKAPWMIGNKFWQQRSKHGRDKLFQSADLLWEAACEYFQWCDDNPWVKVEQKKGNSSIDILELMQFAKKEGADLDQVMKNATSTLIEIPTARPYTYQGLCGYLDGINVGYFNDFEKSLVGKEDADSKDFSVIITRIREVIYQQKFEGATVGTFSATIISRDLGLTDKKEIENNHSGEIKNNIDYSKIPTEALQLILKSQKDEQ